MLLDELLDDGIDAARHRCASLLPLYPRIAALGDGAQHLRASLAGRLQVVCWKRADRKLSGDPAVAVTDRPALGAAGLDDEIEPRQVSIRHLASDGTGTQR